MDDDIKIIVTDVDLERLQPVIEQSDTPLAEALDAELRRATVVPQRDVPPDVVTMNSELVYEDVATGVQRVVRLVYPKDADATAGKISVLAPIGAALLGLHVGQEIEWRVPSGVKRIRVAELRYQPEAAGHAHR
ncbi:MAG: nucleoside diphosphate kinase regulator [Deltaproteobacteria bacterium]|nr:nucleoside diphosphate kinase regulator [Kofleriaceae bacterium]